MSRKEMALAAEIARQNDVFRKERGDGLIQGRTVITRSLAALGRDTVSQALQLVETFDAFTAGNDPYKQHDFGIFMLEGHRMIWKIDYYENEHMEFGAEDPRTSYRLLTIMLAEDY